MLDNILLICGVFSEFAMIISMICVWSNTLKKIIEGQRCQLRQSMLSIYYECKDRKKIRQYQAEHFEKCYHAYKALKGNSFIDTIYEASHEWEVIS